PRPPGPGPAGRGRRRLRPRPGRDLGDGRRRADPRAVVAGLPHRPRARASGWFRAAGFGANDGLVSNFSLVLGMAGAGSSPQVVLLAGQPGLLARALSMAAG